MNNKISFAIVGSGWRAEYFLQIARGCPHLFDVRGIVSRQETKRQELQLKWNVNTYRSIDDLMDQNEIDFLVLAVNKSVASSVIMEIYEKKIPLLAETPPATTMDELIKINEAIEPDAYIQVAEQFFLSPKHSSILSIIESGILGEINFSHISNGHGYHGISLIRKTLGIGFENALISGKAFLLPTIQGPGRDGYPKLEKAIINNHTLATIDFGGKVGLYDFENNQHRSWIRSNRVLIRGERGEINNHGIKYLKDFRTPIEYKLQRINKGEAENLEGYYLKGIIGGEQWLYENPFIPARYCDEEIAIATALIKMKEYISTGKSFYSLAEASQDVYLSLMIEMSIRENREIKTETQIWGKK